MIPIGLAALAAAGWMAPAHAQGAVAAVRHQTVTTRPRPIYDPLGVRRGGFLVLPSLDVAETFNSNIFLTPSRTNDDFITALRPELAVVSQWSNHALQLGAGLDSRLYAEHTGEDFTNFFLKGSGRLDATRDTQLFAGASYNGLHEERGDPNSPAAATDPVDFRLLLANAGLSHRLNRLTVRLTADLASYSYGNAVNATTGAAIVQDTRDRDEYTFTGRVSYDLMPEYQAFVQGSFNNRDYDRLQGSARFDRSSDGYEVVAGTDLNLGDVVFGEVFAGYRSQSYDDPRLSEANGVTGGGRVFWNLTRLTTVTGFVRRSVEETTIGGASGFFSTTGGVSVDHELRRNLLLAASAEVGNKSYEGITREDDELRLSLGGTYLFSRYARAGLSYTFARRNSDAAGSDYTDHKIALSARLQY